MEIEKALAPIIAHLPDGSGLKPGQHRDSPGERRVACPSFRYAGCDPAGYGSADTLVAPDGHGVLTGPGPSGCGASLLIRISFGFNPFWVALACREI